MELVLLYILLPLLGSCAVQVLLLRKVPVRPLRFLLPLGTIPALLRARDIFHTPQMLGGLGALEGVGLVILSGAVVLGWGLGWLVNLWLRRK